MAVVQCHSLPSLGRVFAVWCKSPQIWVFSSLAVVKAVGMSWRSSSSTDKILILGVFTRTGPFQPHLLWLAQNRAGCGPGDSLGCPCRAQGCSVCVCRTGRTLTRTSEPLSVSPSSAGMEKKLGFGHCSGGHLCPARVEVISCRLGAPAAPSLGEAEHSSLSQVLLAGTAL